MRHWISPLIQANEGENIKNLLQNNYFHLLNLFTKVWHKYLLTFPADFRNKKKKKKKESQSRNEILIQCIAREDKESVS